MTFLDSQRTTESYFESKLKNKSKSFQRNTAKVLKQFESFCVTIYNKPASDIINELNRLDDSRKERITFEVLQKFVNYLSEKVRPNTLSTYFSGFKPYLAYMTYSKLHSEDIQSNVDFPKFIEEEAYPLDAEQIKEALKHSSYKRQGIYLTMKSSGMREQEVCKLRKRDFVTKYGRLMIRIPASYTKTGKPRRTFIDLETEPFVRKLLDECKDDDLVYVDNPDSEKASANERMVFAYLRDKKLGLDSLRYESGTHKITLHSFRSFFITKTEKVNEGLGHALSGHSRDQKRYERYNDEELLEFYLKVEPSLSVFGVKSQSQEQLKSEIAEIRRELEETKAKQTKQSYSNALKINNSKMMKSLKAEIIGQIKKDMIKEGVANYRKNKK